MAKKNNSGVKLVNRYINYLDIFKYDSIPLIYYILNDNRDFNMHIFKI